MKLEHSKLLHGKALDHLADIPDGSIRLILTDPPYNVSKKNNLKTMNRKGIDFGEWDKGFDQLGWLDEAARVLMPSGSIVIWNDWKNLGSIANKLATLGFDIKNYLTYLKTNPWPRNMTRRFIQSTEHAFWAVKKSRRKWVFNPRPDESYENGVFPFTVPEDEQPNGIFRFSVQSDAHPNKKPNLMFMDLIRILSNGEDWVLDPYCGSGTICHASELVGRNFIAIEENLEFFNQAKVLWDKAKQSKK